MPPELTAHPTGIRLTQRGPTLGLSLGRGAILAAAWLRQLCRDAGADDVGFVALDRPDVERSADPLGSGAPASLPHRQPLRQASQS